MTSWGLFLGLVVGLNVFVCAQHFNFGSLSETEPVEVKELKIAIQGEIEYVTNVRHELHKIAETTFELDETSQFIKDELTKMKIKFRSVAETGIVGYIPATINMKGGDNVTAVGLRSDMDGLPILENTGKEYQSKHTGKMHACGHDGHMAILLATAKILVQLPYRPNPVTLIFQPAEEVLGGARVLIADGGLLGNDDSPPVGCIFGLHGWPWLELGKVGTRVGELMAGTRFFEIIVTGQQSHGAMPHQGHDPIVAASQIVLALQTVVSRSVSPLESAVVTVASISGGEAHNVIPTTVTLKGTIRYFSLEIDDLIVNRMKEIVKNIAAAMRCSATLEFLNSTTNPVINPVSLTNQFIKLVKPLLNDQLETELPKTTGSEDFAYYQSQVPSVFFMLGTKDPELSKVPVLHQPEYDFDDRALPLGILMMLKLALEPAIMAPI